MEVVKMTNEVAALLGTTADKLHDLCRRGKVNPAPRVAAGRRLWGQESIEAARAYLTPSDEDLLAADHAMCAHAWDGEDADQGGAS